MGRQLGADRRPPGSPGGVLAGAVGELGVVMQLKKNTLVFFKKNMFFLQKKHLPKKKQGICVFFFKYIILLMNKLILSFLDICNEHMR